MDDEIRKVLEATIFDSFYYSDDCPMAPCRPSKGKPFIDMSREEVEWRLTWGLRGSGYWSDDNEYKRLFTWRLGLSDEEWDNIKLFYKLRGR